MRFYKTLTFPILCALSLVFGSCVVFAQKGKMNLALRNVARHLCRPCTFFTDEPSFYFPASLRHAEGVFLLVELNARKPFAELSGSIF